MNLVNRSILGLLFLFFLIHTSIAQDSIPYPKLFTINSTEIKTNVIIDGKLTDSAWLKATETNQFITSEPEEGKVATYKTSVRVLFDKKNMYFGVHCYDPFMSLGIRNANLRRDFNDEESDNFAISLDMEQQENHGVVFAVTPSGNVKDMEVFNFGYSRNENWNTIFNVKTTRNDTGWTAEFQIPFKSIRYQLKNKQTQKDIGIRLVRVARRVNEVSSFPLYNRQFSKFRMTNAAILTGISFPKPSYNIQIKPYVLFQTDQSSQKSEWDSDIKPGIDMKWSITSNKILDASINTDFAQTETDQQIINISRFSNLLPEKRQFFLESASLFTLGDMSTFSPFTSRSIGLNQEGMSIPIQFGLRYVEQNKTNKIGALLVQQEEQVGANKQNSQIGVVTYQKSFTPKFSMTALATHKTSLMNSPASFPRNSSLSLGVVSLHETFYLNALISTSHNDFNQNKAMGVAATLNIELNKRKYWMLFSNTLISPNYNPGLGFLIGTNVIEHFVGFDKNFWPKGKLSKWIRLINPGVELDYYFYSNTYTPLSFQNRFVPLRFFLKNRAKFELYITRWDEFIKEEYRPLNILIDTGKYTFYTSLIIIQSDPSKKLNANLEIRLGEFYNGHFLRNKLVLFYSPSPHVSIQYTLDQTNLFEIGKEKKSGQLLLHVPGVRVSLNPKIHASAFYQYNSLERTGKLNVRFEWEYRPLSYIYLVFNNFKDELVRLEEKQMIAKVNFLYQF